ncbi:glycosyltransferase [Spiribacter sp. 221]|uniref:glycosyltransferase n=1 Tax=Spiribacter onubensis TaxID=3122420 RepID=UPI00349F4AF5
MRPALSVIVPAWNEADYLGDTLTALKRAAEQADIAIETIVVDNASTDATRAIALEHGARVVDESVRRIARVRNTGGRAAKAPGLVFVDADTRVEAVHLRAAHDALDSDWAGGGAMITFDRMDGALQRLGLAGWNALSRRLHLAAGCFVFVRAGLHTELGGFSEKVYAGEEIDYSRRLRRLARQRGLRFAVLDIPPVVSSARKVDWFRPWQHALVLFTFVLFPWAGRFRRLTWFWYRRPD